MRILHLSDTHLYGDPAARHYGRIDPAAALRGVLEQLADLRDVDLVVHSGDASEDGTLASYRLLHGILDPFAARLGAPLVVAMGNHDVPAHYARLAGAGDHGGPWQDRARELPGGGRAIVLDTSVPGAGYGHLDPEQIAWLREVLATPAPGGRGTVMVLHHPPVPAATRLFAALSLDGLPELSDALAGSDVRVVLSGHFHHALAGDLAGIPVHVTPGTTNVVDPLAGATSETALALSGASLVELDDDPSSRPRVTTATWPNTGDARSAPREPVYAFTPSEVDAIVAAAGR